MMERVEKKSGEGVLCGWGGADGAAFGSGCGGAGGASGEETGGSLPFFVAWGGSTAGAASGDHPAAMEAPCPPYPMVS